MSEGRKPGSGRPKGAVSLVSVKMSDLMQKVGSDDLVVCGRMFASKLGVQPVGKAITNPLTPEQKAGLTVVTV